MLIELASILFFFLLGALTLNALPSCNDRKSIVLLSLPIGLSIYLLFNFFYLLCLATLPIWIALPLTISLFILLAKKGIKNFLLFIKASYIFTLSFLLLMIILSITFCLFDFTTLSGDSCHFLEMTQYVSASYQSSDLSLLKGLNLLSYPLSIPLLHVSSALKGQTYLKSIQPIMFTSFLVFLSFSIYDLSKKWFYAILPFLLFFSTYFTVYQLFYINGNLLMGCYILLFFIANEYIKKDKHQPFWLVISALALGSLAFIRMEAPIIATLLLIFFLSNDIVCEKNSRLLFKLFFWVVMLFTLWNGFIFHLAGTGMVSPAQIKGMLAILWITYIVTLLQYKIIWMRKLFYQAPLLLFCALLTIFIFCYSHLHQHMTDSFNGFYANLMGADNYWQHTWLALGILYLVALLLSFTLSFPFKHELIFLLPCYILLLLLLSALRDPYYISALDSGNRMMLHIFPTFLFYLTLFYASSKPQSLRPTNQENHLAK